MIRSAAFTTVAPVRAQSAALQRLRDVELNYSRSDGLKSRKGCRGNLNGC